jgi:hypothetical protein
MRDQNVVDVAQHVADIQMPSLDVLVEPEVFHREVVEVAALALSVISRRTRRGCPKTSSLNLLTKFRNGIWVSSGGWRGVVARAEAVSGRS